MESRTVEYYDENKYTGETGVFRKPSSHRYQSEYRIVVRPGGTERRFLAVGDLSDITSDVIGLAKADEVLKFGQEEAREAGLIWDAP